MIMHDGSGQMGRWWNLSMIYGCTKDFTTDIKRFHNPSPVLWPIWMQFDWIWSSWQCLCVIILPKCEQKPLLLGWIFYTIKVFPWGHLGPRTLRPLILRPPGTWGFQGAIMPACHCAHVLWPILMRFDRIWSGGQRLCTIYCQVVNKNSCY